MLIVTQWCPPPLPDPSLPDPSLPDPSILDLLRTLSHGANPCAGVRRPPHFGDLLPHFAEPLPPSPQCPGTPSAHRPNPPQLSPPFLQTALGNIQPPPSDLCPPPPRGGSLPPPFPSLVIIFAFAGCPGPAGRRPTRRHPPGFLHLGSRDLGWGFSLCRRCLRPAFNHLEDISTQGNAKQAGSQPPSKRQPDESIPSPPRAPPPSRLAPGPVLLRPLLF